MYNPNFKELIDAVDCQEEQEISLENKKRLKNLLHLTDEFYYNLTDGGYLKLEDFFAGEKLEQMQESLDNIIEFENLIHELLEESGCEV
jgi:hypothetical protein